MNEKNKNFDLKVGDLLFQNTGNTQIEQAIKSVTATQTAKNYSHVGIAIKKNKDWFVLESIPTIGVTQTPLMDFLRRNKNKPQASVARLNQAYQKYIPKAIAYGIQEVNTAYDSIFLWDDSAYYCSELIYKMFSSQNIEKDALPFNTHSMTFNDSLGFPLPSWRAYYATFDYPIPEGLEGTNPNLMASSPHLEFIFDYVVVP